jgi:hypothetical protein
MDLDVSMGNVEHQTSVPVK